MSTLAQSLSEYPSLVYYCAFNCVAKPKIGMHSRLECSFVEELERGIRSLDGLPSGGMTIGVLVALVGEERVEDNVLITLNRHETSL